MNLKLQDCLEAWPQLKWTEFQTLCLQHWSEKQVDKILIAKLAGGHSRDYLFTAHINEQEYVLRMVDSSRLGGEEVAKISTIASTHKLAPKVIFYSPDARIILMHKLPGKTVQIEELKTNDTIVIFADSMRQIHNIQAHNNVKPERLFSDILKWYEEQSDYPFLKHGFFKALKERYDELNESYQVTKMKLKLLHGDINPSNIFLYKNQCIYIDWEFAGTGNPLQEIARTFEWFNYSKQQRAVFTETYFDGHTPCHIVDSIEAKQVMTYLEMFWRCLSFLPKEIISEDNILQSFQKIEPFTLHDMAQNIQKGIIRKTDNCSMLKEAIGFLKCYSSRC